MISVCFTATTITTHSGGPTLCRPRQLDLVFVVDSSGSIEFAAAGNWNRMLTYIQDSVSGFRFGTDDVRVGLVRFSNNGNVEFYLDDYKDLDEMLTRIGQVGYIGGTTNTADGIQLANEMLFSGTGGDRPDVDNVMVVVTDGYANERAGETIDEARKARRLGIRIIAVGVSDEIDIDELEAIASSVDDVILVEKFTELTDSLDVVFGTEVCPLTTTAAPTQSTTPASTTRTHITTTTVTNRPSTTITTTTTRTTPTVQTTTTTHTTTQTPAPTRTTTTPPTTTTTEDTCPKMVDIVFIVDSSGSIEEQVQGNWGRILLFIQILVSNLVIGPDDVRVGMVKFSNFGHVEFLLGQYDRTEDVLAAIARVSYVGGNTNTAAGLQLTHEILYQTSNGDRAGAHNLAFLITDGAANVRIGDTLSESVNMKTIGIEILVIGVSEEVDEGQLQVIATSPGHVILVDTFDDLIGIMDNALSLVCEVRPQTSIPSSPSTTQRHTLFPTTTPSTPVHTPTHASGSCPKMIDIVFIVDSSGSIEEQVQGNWGRILLFIQILVSNLVIGPDDVRVGMVKFGYFGHVEFLLCQYDRTEDVLAAIARVSYVGGNTNTAAGLQLTHEILYQTSNGDRAGAHNLAFLITDGAANVRIGDTLPESVNMKTAGIEIVVIGVSEEVDEGQLQVIATSPNHVILVDTFDDLIGIMDDALDFACAPTTGLPTPSTTTTSPTPTSPTTPPRCDTDLDLVFILDSSGSIETAVPGSWKSLLEDVVLTIERFTIGPENTQLSLIIYSNSGHVEFLLNDYPDEFSMTRRIRSTRYIGGTTNTADGLELAHSVVFTSEYGDRPTVDNVAVLITDGESNERMNDTATQAELLQGTVDRLIVIGVGDQVNVDELYGIASSPDDLILVDKYDVLPGVLHDVVVVGACPTRAPGKPVPYPNPSPKSLVHTTCTSSRDLNQQVS